MQIDADFFFGKSLIDKYVLRRIQEICQTIAPCWSKGLEIRDPKAGAPRVSTAHPDALYDAVMFDITTRSPFHQKLERQLGTSPEERICGQVELRGADPSITILMGLDESRFNQIGGVWTWGNSLTFQFRRPRVEGIKADEFARRVFEAVCSHLGPWYAHAEDPDEFAAKNILSDREGTRAVGIDLSSSLPGLYWLNFFGSACVDEIGRSRFASCRAFERVAFGEGFILSLGQSAGEWTTAAYSARVRDTIRHLGEAFFFDRNAPERATRSPFAIEPG